MGNDHLKQQMIRKEGIFYLQIGHKLASKLEQVLILLKCHVSTLWTFAGGAFAQNTPAKRSPGRIFL